MGTGVHKITYSIQPICLPASPQKNQGHNESRQDTALAKVDGNIVLTYSWHAMNQFQYYTLDCSKKMNFIIYGEIQMYPLKTRKAWSKMQKIQNP